MGQVSINKTYAIKEVSILTRTLVELRLHALENNFIVKSNAGYQAIGRLVFIFTCVADAVVAFLRLNASKCIAIDM